MLTNALRGVPETRLAPGEAARWRASLSISLTDMHDTGRGVQASNVAPSASSSGRHGQPGPGPARAVRG